MFIYYITAFALCLFPHFLSAATDVSHEKILICGVGKNVAIRLSNLIGYMEQFGSYFADYQILLYENDSTDETVDLMNQHAGRNPHIHFVSEKFQDEELFPRTVRIARARNKVLDMAKNPLYSDYKFLVMTDLDLLRDWAIPEMLVSIQNSDHWDAVFANGIFANPHFYYDRYAFRNSEYPFGPELLGDHFWDEVFTSWFQVLSQTAWIPVYSAFGGFAIYKTSIILHFTYSGTVTDELAEYYQVIAANLPSSSPHLEYYLNKNGLGGTSRPLPIVFCENSKFERKDLPSTPPYTCCEHLPLHASMALRGYGRFYINPQMVVHYE